MSQKTFSVYISKIDGYIGDICADVFAIYLNGKDCATSNLQFFLENWFDIESDKSVTVKQYFSEDEYVDGYEEVSPVMERLILKLIEKNYIAEKFYELLWESMNNDILFSTELEKICALLYVLISPRIPYFQMGEALQMEEEEYSVLSETVNLWYKKARFVLNRGYAQRTEEASQLISILNEISDEKQKVVYVARLIGHSRSRISRLEKKIKELQGENPEDSQ